MRQAHRYSCIFVSVVFASVCGVGESTPSAGPTAAASEGKWPRALIARRYRFIHSITEYRLVLCDQVYVLPPDIREWLPPDWGAGAGRPGGGYPRALRTSSAVGVSANHFFEHVERAGVGLVAVGVASRSGHWRSPPMSRSTRRRAS
jgi:hypothetical protein